MSGSHKAGIAGGIVLAAGIGARSMDDCARAGGRVARSVDDSAVRSVGLLDEAGRARAGAQAESHWAGHAVELGLDVELELLQMDPIDTPAMPSASTVKCPRIVAVTRDAGAWAELLGGLGIACAPIVLVGTTDETGANLMIDGVPTPITNVIDTCLGADAHCLVAGCPAPRAEACEQAVAEGLRATRLTPDLAAYERALAADLLTRADGPRLLAQHVAQDGRAQLAIARRSTQ